MLSLLVKHIICFVVMWSVYVAILSKICEVSNLICAKFHILVFLLCKVTIPMNATHEFVAWNSLTWLKE